MTNSNLISVFKNFLAAENLEDQKLLLMVSGGVDSMALLDVASKVMNCEQLAVFHLDHGARDQSSEDRKFVQNICSKLDIQFYSEKLSPAHKNKPEKGNKEARWRNVRQTLSSIIAENFGAISVLTAHHATDLVETMIFRITKGCGPSGLSPFDTHTKPFWQLPKSAIIKYAEEQQLQWREDPTNQDPKYQRNLIRHQVLPALREITPNLEKVFVQESYLFGEVETFLSCHSELRPESKSLKDFLALPPILQKTWLRKISGATPSLSEIEDCRRWLQGSPAGNTKKTLGDKILQIRKNHICFEGQ